MGVAATYDGIDADKSNPEGAFQHSPTKVSTTRMYDKDRGRRILERDIISALYSEKSNKIQCEHHKYHT